jgi:acetyl-CoA carboxylase carboxyltransferase component
VPKITLIIRKAYGGGYIAMCSHHLRADFVFSWPTAEIAVMGPEGAANIIFRNEIKNAENPDVVRKLKIKEYKQKFANPYVAAAYGYIDAVIEPVETRKKLIHALEISAQKKEEQPKKKHGIPPF